MNPQKILLLQIENFKCIKAFHAEFDANASGELVVLSGENGHGKSSCLDAILSAATGQLPAEPLRHGAEDGTILMKTPDFVFKIRLTQKGQYFELSNPEGAVYKQPRTLLSKFYNAIGFDPLAFAMMKDGERTEALLRVCPVKIDLAVNAKEAKQLYDDRRDANREVDRITKHLASLPEQKQPVQPMVSVVELNTAKNKRLEAHAIRGIDLNTELEKLREQEKGHVTKRQALKDAELALADLLTEHTTNAARITELQVLLEQAEIKQKQLTADLHTAQGKVVEASNVVAVLPDLLPRANEIKAKLNEVCDTADIDAKIAAAEKINAAYEEARQAANARTEAAGQLEDAQAEAKKLDDAYAAKLQEREDALKAAEFPVEGLTIDETGTVRLGGVPFGQASTAQKIKVGVALAAAASPTLRVVTVRDGSLLDTTSMAVLREMAAKHNLQVWVERVQDTSEGAIQIVDGHRE